MCATSVARDRARCRIPDRILREAAAAACASQQWRHSVDGLHERAPRWRHSERTRGRRRSHDDRARARQSSGCALHVPLPVGEHANRDIDSVRSRPQQHQRGLVDHGQLRPRRALPQERNILHDSRSQSGDSCLPTNGHFFRHWDEDAAVADAAHAAHAVGVGVKNAHRDAQRRAFGICIFDRGVDGDVDGVGDAV